jgi:putative oxidoreductase
MFRPLPGAWSPKLISIFRIVAAFLFMAHGTQKLFGFPLAEPRPPVDLFSLMGLAGVLETFGGALLLMGLFTHPVALLLAAEMAIAYVMAHVPNGSWPILNGGELAMLYCAAFLMLAGTGGGPWSLDAMIAHRETDFDVRKRGIEHATERRPPTRAKAARADIRFFLSAAGGAPPPCGAPPRSPLGLQHR